MVEQEVAASKPKRTVSFLAPSTELRSSEVTITPSFSIVSNLSQISQSELDLDISQPQASQSQQKAWPLGEKKQAAIIKHEMKIVCDNYTHT